MTELEAKRIYEMQNHENLVAKCPEPMRQLVEALNIWTEAAVNLYGVISSRDLLDEFDITLMAIDSHNIKGFLMPYVLANKKYFFYDDYVVKRSGLKDLDGVQKLIKDQAGKPRYSPSKAEFAKYADPAHCDMDEKEALAKVGALIRRAFPQNPSAIKFLRDVRRICKKDRLKDLKKVAAKHQIVFTDQRKAEEFAALVNAALQKTRLQKHKGLTPEEFENNVTSQNLPNLKDYYEIYLDDPCACGSGKLYEDCCYPIQEAKTAQLSKSDCKLFYETWYGLLAFVNERTHTLKEKVIAQYPNSLEDFQFFGMREEVCEKPEWIDKYLAEGQIPADQVEIVRSWRNRYKKGIYLMINYEPEHAVAFDFKTHKAYGIKGISHTISQSAQMELPYKFETVLLPFKDVIVYDTFMGLEQPSENIEIYRGLSGMAKRIAVSKTF
ncbi:MAG: SEC-C domain-containing protein [Clostridiales bacterium]|jgi:hypothetical protein|nr:SEC-C domain-containing protein [Clostridiales bacterium]